MKTAIVIFIILCLIAWLVYVSIFNYRRYEYDEFNPYRRTCKDCGSYQVMFSDPDFERSWWEEFEEGNNPKCKCHWDSIINTY